MTRTSRRIASGLALGACMAVAAWAPGVAAADTYASAGDAQSFAGSAGGWTNSTTTDGLCIAPLVCPTITNEHVASGGLGGAGDGYIRSSLQGVTSTTLATSSGTWESPAFTYNGNGGVTPANASLTFSVLPDIQALLGADVLNDSTVKVDIVDQTNDSALSVYPPTTPLNNNIWTTHAGLPVSTAQLVIGRAYKIRITTTYHTVLAVVPSGSVGYDGVTLTTSGTADGSGGNGNGNGTGGAGAGAGAGGVLGASQQCALNVKKKIKKKKLSPSKRKKLLKKKLRNCNGKKVKKKKKVKKRK